ncbi:MAG: Uncharacterized protein E1N59_1388 [Puniceicoccaceae bacterium 5H]|nr:MAG: Uncharacterized protein E1N59_1388 [Puniceicoccaceae bacterium 5H]
MPGQEWTDEVLVLGREASGEAHLRTWCFSRENGRILVMQRAATRKGKALASLDLFDHAEVRLERRSTTGAGFLKEVRHIAQHEALAQHYGSFQAAATWNRWVRDNLPTEQPDPDLFALTLQTWQALIRSHRPALVLLKALFRWTRHEGYPVAEGWLAGLPSAEREEVYQWLSRPLAELEVGDDAVRPSLQQLQRFLEHHADLRLIG